MPAYSNIKSADPLAHALSLALGTMALCFFVACGVEMVRVWQMPHESVAGQVVLNGRPLADAQVTLHPADELNEVRTPASGKTDAGGLFRVSTIGFRNGAPAGKYAVTVSWTPPVIDGESLVPGPNRLPSQYASPHTSPLEVAVERGRDNFFTVQFASYEEAAIAADDEPLFWKSF